MKKHVLCTTLLVETSPQALPLGVACVASAIKNSMQDVSVEIIDFSPEQESLKNKPFEKQAEVIAAEIIEKKAPVVCFSVYVWNRHALFEAAKIVRKKCPDTLLLAGGPEITAQANFFQKAKEMVFDCVICGEGEDATSVVIKNFFDEGKKPTEKVQFANPCNLEMLSSPYVDGTLDAAKYSGALWELARGCPYSCSYCYESKGEKQVRYFPKKRLYEELDYFVASDIAQVFVLDPTYNVEKNRALDLLRYIEKKAPDIFFHFECRAELLDKSLVQAFSKILCSLQIGLQSSNEKVLSLVNRPFNKKDFIRNIAMLNDAGVVFGFDVIYGLPGETYESFLKSIDFALELYPNHIEIFQLAVLPGTDLFDRAEELRLSFMKEAPYLVLDTPIFSKSDIEKAKTFSFAASLFYTQGRAVPWFLSLIKPLQKRPSQIIIEFMSFIKTNGITKDKNLSFDDIVLLQKDFIKGLYTKANVKHLIRFSLDIIDLNAAVSRYIAEGTESTVHLNYHPDDLLSPYSQDPKYFVKHAEAFSCTVEVSKEVEKRTGEIYTIIFDD